MSDDEGFFFTGDVDLVPRFAKFAMNLINVKMEPFFAKHMHFFDQEIEAINNRGETIEQYQAFKEYEKELEKNLMGFLDEEGFTSPKYFLKEVERLVEDDKKRVKEQMEQLMKQLMELMAEVMGGGPADANSATPQVPMMFFKPQGQDEMLDTIISLGEYSTFSALMRARVAQEKLIKMVLDMQRMMTEERNNMISNYNSSRRPELKEPVDQDDIHVQADFPDDDDDQEDEEDII